MPNIFNYMDFREFLKDFYTNHKAENPGFSFQIMADKAGFKSKSFIKLVIDGKKNLTADSLRKLNKVLKLNDNRKRNPGRLVMHHQYDFYAKWYHNTIRELVTFYKFNEDYDALAKMVMPPISARTARESVRLLLKLELIKKKKDGYVQTSPLLTTGDEVKSVAVQNFHVQNMVLGAESIDTCPSPERDISCLALGLSKEGFEMVKTETQMFRKKLLQIAKDDRRPNRVYHYSIQLFPTSQKID